MILKNDRFKMVQCLVIIYNLLLIMKDNNEDTVPTIYHTSRVD